MSILRANAAQLIRNILTVGNAGRVRIACLYIDNFLCQNDCYLILLHFSDTRELRTTDDAGNIHYTLMAQYTETKIVVLNLESKSTDIRFSCISVIFKESLGVTKRCSKKLWTGGKYVRSETE